jgi:5-methylcytosine-specific restriction endonuclease McrA
MKTCTVCGIDKSINEFEKGRAMCKPCRLLKKKETYQKAKVKGKTWATDPHKRFSLFKRLAFNTNLRCTEKVSAEEIEQYLGEPKTCWLCGEALTIEEVQVDHIHPRAKGGLNIIENLAYAHSHCNYIKRDHTIEELKPILEKILNNLK